MDFEKNKRRGKRRFITDKHAKNKELDRKRENIFKKRKQTIDESKEKIDEYFKEKSDES